MSPWCQKKVQKMGFLGIPGPNSDQITADILSYSSLDKLSTDVVHFSAVHVKTANKHNMDED